MNGLELLALIGASLAGCVATLASVALWHRRQLAEIAQLRREAEQVRDKCVELWLTLSPPERRAAPLTLSQRVALDSMVLLDQLRTALTRLGRKS